MTKKQLEKTKKQLLKLIHSADESAYCELLIQEVFDYIAELAEENLEYELLMKMQNNRKYKSNFLKDFHKEYGNNVYPDYDEVYKRYDDMKERMKKARKCIAKHAEGYYTEDLWEAMNLLENSWGVPNERR